MSRPHAKAEPQQLGFDALLEQTDRRNRETRQERALAHLPATMDAALPFYRALVNRHHAAMLAADGATVMALREEAHALALKLNGFRPGIVAEEDSPGCVLERETRAPDGTVPRWGQAGRFMIAHGEMRVAIEIDGLFGIGACFSTWMGFSAHAVDWSKPFLSETGYRSFLGLQGDLSPGVTPDAFAFRVVAAHVAKELKG